MSHYDTLGISKTATPEEIKKAYRKLASQHHPDKGGDTAKFQEIEEAYRVLSDPSQRLQYDNPASHGTRFNFQDFGHGVPPEMQDIFRNFGFNFGGSPFGPHHHHQRKNKDLRIELTLTLAETMDQQKRVVSIQTTKGTRETVSVDIPRGVNNGTQIKYPNLGDNFFESLPRGDLFVNISIVPDSKYQIRGIDLFSPVDIDCIDAIIGCSVEFTTLDDKTFSLTIPPGTQNGTKFKVGGQGLYVMNQNIRGNLYLMANIIIPTNLSQEQLETLRQLKQPK